MKTDELREKYLSFFESKGCIRRPSDVLVPKDDPTVLFTPAGMNQFKNQFLGIGPLEFTKATTCQKCLRTGDISNVGVTAYHHTFFEMLGNFSFGDYFKEGAIELAWDLVTKSREDGGWGLEESKLYPTVYVDDPEAVDLWRKVTGFPAERILKLGKKENYWSMGVPGPGGPCSEILYDRGSSH
ncbi:MAG TPA: alanine--tRNA ligase-related protein, partial [Planctomycetaceae bacterium]|nr:alanine--tRNA ligase-related protein [Planctomycetaceae bacterium]